MTTPYPGWGHKSYPGDNVQRETAFVPADGSTIKALMEVYRDTANLLDAEKVLHIETRKIADHEQQRVRDLVTAQDGQLAEIGKLNNELKAEASWV